METSQAIEIARTAYSGTRMDDDTTAEAMTALVAADTPEAADWAHKLRAAVGNWPYLYPLTLAAAPAAALEPEQPAHATGIQTSGAHKLVLSGYLTIAAFFFIGLINAKWVYPALGYQNDLGCSGVDCSDYAATNLVVTGAQGALEAFNPVIFWAAFGPGLIAGMILIGAGRIVTEMQKRT